MAGSTTSGASTSVASTSGRRSIEPREDRSPRDASAPGPARPASPGREGSAPSSRVLPERFGGYRLGVLVQTNFGGVLTIAGAPVGKELGRYEFNPDSPRRRRAAIEHTVRARGAQRRLLHDRGGHRRPARRPRPQATGRPGALRAGTDRIVLQQRQRRLRHRLHHLDRAADPVPAKPVPSRAASSRPMRSPRCSRPRSRRPRKPSITPCSRRPRRPDRAGRSRRSRSTRSARSSSVTTWREYRRGPPRPRQAPDKGQAPRPRLVTMTQRRIVVGAVACVECFS